VDQLILRADGKFIQVYRDSRHPEDNWETPQWQEWRLERFKDGEVLVRLNGGRYYLAGTRVAEAKGFWEETRDTEMPRTFFDPFSDSYLHMVDELVLSVRQDKASGEFLLHHMWLHNDRGFAVFGGDAEMFRLRR
jgi:hypothetical protein